MRIIDCAQRSEEWFAARAGIATASCFSSILATIKKGEAAERRNYRAKLVIERLTGKCLPSFQTPAMALGVEREPFARAAYESKTDAWVSEVGFIRHDEIEAGCSPDGLIDTAGCLEIKCPGLATHLDYLKLPPGTCPSEYESQVQGQMWLAEREWCDFISWNPEFPPNLQMVVRRVVRNETDIKALAMMIECFMAEVREEEAALRRMAA